MKSKIMGVALLSLTVGWFVLPNVSGAAESSAPVVAAAAASAAVVADDEHEYLGAKSCKMCHSAVFKSWEETRHAKAMETLMPGNAAEVKQKFGLDPAMDYTKDEKCIRCHTTGFGKPGGYAMPAEGDEKAVKAAEKMAGVGCESCHGPGGGLKDFKKELQKEKDKTYKFEELAALGMVKIEETTCIACHNTDSPTVAKDFKFDFEAMKAKEGGIHAHEPLKQRAE